MNLGVWYTLDEDGKPKPCEDIEEWAAWMDTYDRRVRLTPLADGGCISTVFLGVDHAHPGERGPLVFETMIFAGNSSAVWQDLEGEMQRYPTREDAIAGHDAMVERVYKAAPALRLSLPR